jgi:hypothetical protein
MSVEEMEFSNKFDGIWACASLLHIPYLTLHDVFGKCYKALTKDGIMYCSFKYGTYEGERNGRYFTDMTLDKLECVLKGAGFNIIEYMITDDVRPDRDEKWLNVVLKKM